MKHWDYFSLCAKRLSGEISAEENAALDEWLSLSPDNRKRMEEITAAWRLSEPGSLPVTPDAESGWRVLEQSLGLASAPATVRSRTVGIRPAWLSFLQAPRTRAAWACLGLSVLALFSFWALRTRTFSDPVRILESANRQRLEVVLSDGSRIRLNSGSRLSYPARFTGKERKVTLSGQAFFDVAHGSKPFVVATADAKTTVLGTRFDVWAREGATRLVVQQGRVAFSSGSGNGTVILTRNRMSRSCPDGSVSEPESVDADRMLGWLEGRMVFDRAPVSEVLAELKRTLDVTVILEDADLASRTVTAEFDKPAAETVLSSLCLSLGASFTKTNGRYVIQKD